MNESTNDPLEDKIQAPCNDISSKEQFLELLRLLRMDFSIFKQIAAYHVFCVVVMAGFCLGCGSSQRGQSRVEPEGEERPLNRQVNKNNEATANATPYVCIIYHPKSGNVELTGDDYDKARRILIYAKKIVTSCEPVSEFTVKASPECRMLFYRRGETEDAIYIYEWNDPIIDINGQKYGLTPELYAPIREFLDGIDWTRESLPK